MGKIMSKKKRRKRVCVSETNMPSKLTATSNINKFAVQCVTRELNILAKPITEGMKQMKMNVIYI